MNEKPPAPVRQPTLLEAQAILFARRAALRREREEAGASSTSGDLSQSSAASDPCSADRVQCSVVSEQGLQSDNCLPVTDNFSHDNGPRSAAQLGAIVAGLPAHLGWGSAPLTAALRAAARRGSVSSKQWSVSSEQYSLNSEPLPHADNCSLDISGGPPAPRVFSAVGEVPLPPSLGLAILQKKLAASGRLWLLLRAIDEAGTGVVARATARSAFCAEESGLRFCGHRHLRGLLAEGQGLFWTCSGDAIWLRSAARVARDLGVGRFRGRSVAVPISSLTGGIAQVRAELYASFHSGREAAPVSRQTIARHSGVPARTQRHYDRLSGVKKSANYARGPRLGSAEAESQAWQRGPASFAWRDAGHDGATRFLAWQLPNSYHGPHARLGRGRQKRLNRALADLPTKGTAGNGQGWNDDLPRRYFAHARAAARAFDRVHEETIYWPDVHPGVWHCLWWAAERGVGF